MVPLPFLQVFGEEEVPTPEDVQESLLCAAARGGGMAQSSVLVGHSQGYLCAHRQLWRRARTLQAISFSPSSVVWHVGLTFVSSPCACG